VLARWPRLGQKAGLDRISFDSSALALRREHGAGSSSFYRLGDTARFCGGFGQNRLLPYWTPGLEGGRVAAHVALTRACNVRVSFFRDAIKHLPYLPIGRLPFLYA